MKSKHSPGPWAALTYCIYAQTDASTDVYNRLVAETSIDDSPIDLEHEECAANAERIVACVNALEGIENPEAIQKAIWFIRSIAQESRLAPDHPNRRITDGLQVLAKEVLELLGDE